MNCIHHVCKLGNYTPLKLLFDTLSKPAIQAKTVDQPYALHLAMESNSAETIKYLIENFRSVLDIHCLNGQYHTPYVQGVTHFRWKSVQLC